VTSGRLRVGIAGAGWVAGARHLPVLRARDDVEVVAIYDTKRERAEAMRQKAVRKDRPPVAAFTDLDDFLASGLDVVHVTTAPFSHHEITMRALDAGAHVFTEKPMAMNSLQATEMAKKALDVDRLLCVSHNFLYSRSMTTAKAKFGGIPVDYVLGLQLSAETRRLPTWYRDLPGGLMFDEAPHMMYSLNNLLGGELALDHARGTFGADGHPRTVEVLVRGRTGNGQVTMVFCAPVSEWHVVASAPSRVVGIDLFRDIAVDLKPDGAHGSFDIARTSMSLVAGHAGGFARAGARWVARRQYWGHDELISEFVEAIRFGRSAPVPIQDALNVVSLTDDLLAALDVTTGGSRA
jgi:scyllo-inositol 2-dehydrogenase (NADP+)